MADPVLLAVDADPAALSDVERELRDRYASNYRVLCTPSPSEALGSLARLSDAGEEVALVLAAQWLSGTTGSALLERVRQLHPHAKRGLLVPSTETGCPLHEGEASPKDPRLVGGRPAKATESDTPAGQEAVTATR